MVGRKWLKGFLKCHPEITLKTAKNLSIASTGAGVSIAGGQHIVVTADVHWPNVQQAGRQNRSI